MYLFRALNKFDEIINPLKNGFSKYYKWYSNSKEMIICITIDIFLYIDLVGKDHLLYKFVFLTYLYHKLIFR